MSAKRRKRIKKDSVPNSLILLGRNIEVKITDLNKEPDNGTTYGMCHGHEHRIEVDLHHPQGQNQLNSTLFHEAAHMVLHLTGLTEMLHSANDNLEEAVICAFETAFADYINMGDLSNEKQQTNIQTRNDGQLREPGVSDGKNVT